MQLYIKIPTLRQQSLPKVPLKQAQNRLNADLLTSVMVRPTRTTSQLLSRNTSKFYKFRYPYANGDNIVLQFADKTQTTVKPKPPPEKPQKRPHELKSSLIGVQVPFDDPEPKQIQIDLPNLQKQIYQINPMAFGLGGVSTIELKERFLAPATQDVFKRGSYPFVQFRARICILGQKVQATKIQWYRSIKTKYWASAADRVWPEPLDHLLDAVGELHEFSIEKHFADLVLAIPDNYEDHVQRFLDQCEQQYRQELDALVDDVYHYQIGQADRSAAWTAAIAYYHQKRQKLMPSILTCQEDDDSCAFKSCHIDKRCSYRVAQEDVQRYLEGVKLIMNPQKIMKSDKLTIPERHVFVYQFVSQTTIDLAFYLAQLLELFVSSAQQVALRCGSYLEFAVQQETAMLGQSEPALQLLQLIKQTHWDLKHQRVQPVRDQKISQELFDIEVTRGLNGERRERVRSQLNRRAIEFFAKDEVRADWTAQTAEEIYERLVEAEVTAGSKCNVSENDNGVKQQEDDAENFVGTTVIDPRTYVQNVFPIYLVAAKYSAVKAVEETAAVFLASEIGRAVERQFSDLADKILDEHGLFVDQLRRLGEMREWKRRGREGDGTK